MSYVNVAYIAAAMGPYKNNQSGYVGSPLLISQFQPKLMNFEKKFNWPTFIDLDGTKAANSKIAIDAGAACETERRKRANRSCLRRNPGPPTSGRLFRHIRTDWTTYSSTCQHSAQGFTTFCDAILDVRDLFAANYKQYQALLRLGSAMDNR